MLYLQLQMIHFETLHRVSFFDNFANTFLLLNASLLGFHFTLTEFAIAITCRYELNWPTEAVISPGAAGEDVGCFDDGNVNSFVAHVRHL